jgi:hypothetical protein
VSKQEVSLVLLWVIVREQHITIQNSVLSTTKPLSTVVVAVHLGVCELTDVGAVILRVDSFLTKRTLPFVCCVLRVATFFKHALIDTTWTVDQSRGRSLLDI